ncbi:hypothetical protein QQS21_004631 [Conoideocrella luteorostrata]|uniref:Uncharacterized protein n=1 Tax=Conoideocrella luteorostrata TaxID=1105319 RepID=A0AAJ0CR16_9HYPO|nr:hypothetical protein QQS21_004631 [Conoideocrella luteorostrata]
MEDQINAAMKAGHEVEVRCTITCSDSLVLSAHRFAQKIVLIGGFAMSKSLRTYIQTRLTHFNSQNNSQVLAVFPEKHTVTAVASGAVLRALNKEQGPQRKARSSYGILRAEPFGTCDEHKGLRPSYDRHDGHAYIRNTIDWVLKRASISVATTIRRFLTYRI